MRKKQIITLLFAVCILTACADTSDKYKTPDFSFDEPFSSDYSSFSAVESSSESRGESSSESKGESSSEEFSSESSAVQSSSDGDIQSSVQGSSVSSTKTLPQSSNSSEEMSEAVTDILLDPINERTISCNKNIITMTGTVCEGFKPSISIPHTEKYTVSNGIFTYTAVIRENFTGYGNISVIKDGNIRIYAQKGNVEVVRSAEAEEANEKAVKGAIDQPMAQVAEYIAVNADKEKITEILGKITELSDKICEGLNNDYDKLRAISQWVSANIYYDYKAYGEGVPAETLTLEYMLENSSSVCGGYSNMTSALAAVQGIKVYNVHGSAVNNGYTFAEKSSGEYHEWNFALLDGRVVWIDSGWNSYCYRYSDGRYKNGGIGVKYFDISAEALSQNHKAKYAEYRDYFKVLDEM